MVGNNHNRHNVYNDIQNILKFDMDIYIYIYKIVLMKMRCLICVVRQKTKKRDMSKTPQFIVFLQMFKLSTI